MERFTPANRGQLIAAIRQMNESTGIHSEHGHINDWDVSRVTDMSNMFDASWHYEHNEMLYAFNQPLDRWNVSNVTNMSGMFDHSIAFNQPLNRWNVSKVTNMQCMFYDCRSFNQPLNSWNVSNVTDMSWMFYDCRAFHQVLPWKLCVDVETVEMFVGSHGSLLERRSPGTIRRRNGELAHSIIKRSNHPNMMHIDDDHFSPIEADAPDFTRRLMANVRKRSPDLLVGKRKTQTEKTMKRKRSRSRSRSRKGSSRK